MACNNDGGPSRRCDKCDKRGRESSRSSENDDFLIPDTDVNSVQLAGSTTFILDLYNNLEIEFGDS